MNSAILHKEVQDFINAHLFADITKTILKGSPFPDVSIQELAAQIEAKEKCKTKLPSWYSTSNIYYPNKLNIAQTSSETAALHKAQIVSGAMLIDLTGGFGVDSFYFSKRMAQVRHIEINEILGTIASHNFKELCADNILSIQANGLSYLKKLTKKVDWLYIDPSRRDDKSSKVFLLKDCSPDVVTHIDLLLEHSENILIKVSPLLDLKNTINSLKFIKAIHIVAVKNEVKELLFIIKKDHHLPCSVNTYNYSHNQLQEFHFKQDEQGKATYSLPKKYLYEPNAALLKSGAFELIASRLNLCKLEKNSHLYTSDACIDFPGRRFLIKHESNYSKKALLKLIPSKKANITTRNFPDNVAKIRKRTTLKDGGSIYAFFTTNKNQTPTVLLCEKC